MVSAKINKDYKTKKRLYIDQTNSKHGYKENENDFLDIKNQLKI